MRAIVIGEETLEIENGTHVLEYAVLVGGLYGESGRLVGESYGVRVRMTEEPGVPGEVDWKKTAASCEHVKDVTTRHTDILELVRKLRRCRVTPVSLIDVTTDYLG